MFDFIFDAIVEFLSGDTIVNPPVVFDPLDQPINLPSAPCDAGDALTQVAVEDAPVEPMSVEEFADRISYANDHSALFA